MKKFVTAVVALSLLWTQSASALLHPLHQQSREIKAIFAAEELRDAVGSEMIITIHKNGMVYTIISENHEIDATIVPEPQAGHLGPMRFHIEFSEPKAR